MQMNIGEKLKLRRRKAGFTQEQIASRMNITRQTLSNWEIGKNTPDIDSIISLAEIYGLSLDELLLGKIYFKGVPAMVPKRTDEEILTIIRSHYDKASDITELTGGLASQTFAFRVNDQRFVFKMGTRKETHEKEQWVYNRYHDRLPLRRLIEIHESEHQPPYAIYHFVDGVKLNDLNSQESVDIVPSVLENLSLLNAIEVTDADGFGRFDGTGTAPYPSWLDFINAVYNEKIYNWSEVEKKGLDAELIDAAIQKIKRGAGSITISKKQLIHGDLGSYNLIAEHQRITGIIDWSLAMYGDHLYDIANFMFWNEDKLQPLIAKLKANYMNTAENQRAITIYMLRIGLEELYNTVILSEAGYDVDWVANRLQRITKEAEI
jgi:hygromycin-B 4-O-kinase